MVDGRRGKRRPDVERIEIVQEDDDKILNTYMFGTGADVDGFVRDYVASMPAGRYVRRMSGLNPGVRARLSWKQVHRIRFMRLHHFTALSTLSVMFGVSVSTIGAILDNNTWTVQTYYRVPGTTTLAGSERVS